MRSCEEGTWRKVFLEGAGARFWLYRDLRSLSWETGGAGAFCLKAKMREAPSTFMLEASNRWYSSRPGETVLVPSRLPSSVPFSLERLKLAVSRSMADRLGMKRSSCRNNGRGSSDGDHGGGCFRFVSFGGCSHFYTQCNLDFSKERCIYIAHLFSPLPTRSLAAESKLGALAVGASIVAMNGTVIASTERRRGLKPRCHVIYWLSGKER